MSTRFSAYEFYRTLRKRGTAPHVHWSRYTKADGTVIREGLVVCALTVGIHGDVYKEAERRDPRGLFRRRYVRDQYRAAARFAGTGEGLVVRLGLPRNTPIADRIGLTADDWAQV